MVIEVSHLFRSLTRSECAATGSSATHPATNVFHSAELGLRLPQTVKVGPSFRRSEYSLPLEQVLTGPTNMTLRLELVKHHNFLTNF